MVIISNMDTQHTIWYLPSESNHVNVRPLSCVSCVPASCFLIWLVSCPRFMSLLVNSVPGVCVWLWVYYHVYLSPVCWVPCGLVYSSLPVFMCVYLDVVIKDYYFEVSPRLRVPRLSLQCAPWQKTRPNSKRRPFTSFCFVRFFKFFGCSGVLSLAASESARREPSCPPFAAQPSRCSREFTPPSSDSMPAGLPLTQARRIVADSSSPDCCWLMPAGRRPWGKPTHHRQLPLLRGEGQPAVCSHSVRRRLWLPPARRSPPLSGQASRLWSRQPAVAVFWPDCDQGLFKSCFVCV